MNLDENWKKNIFLCIWPSEHYTLSLYGVYYEQMIISPIDVGVFYYKIL